MTVNAGFELNESNVDVTVDTEDDTKQKVERETWGKGIHFLMSCIAMSVGLGNIWRFPFTAYENGGGAFLIPYLIVLTFVGRPIYFLEMCLGQFSSKGSFKTLESLCPILKGVGFGQIFGCVCGTSYYCSLLALALFYLFHSFTFNLPWAECAPEWQGDGIVCVPALMRNFSNYSGETVRSSSELWFVKEVLKEKIQIEDGIGWPEWRLTLFLFLSWVAVFAISARGIKSLGKASYFLALFPYVIIITLLIHTVTLKGSAKGILYFLQPQWGRLLEAKVWYNAITQSFFSLNIGSSIIPTYSSYNNFRQNIYRDSLIVTSLDTLTSLISGVTIFGILGNLANELGVDVTSVLSSGGARLAFISYPDAIAKFDSVPWLFSILFFLMLYVLGIGSMVAGQACLYTFVKYLTPSFKKWHVSLIVATGGFLLGLPYLTPGGQFVLTLVDYYAVTFIFFILTTAEVVAVIWWYGLENVCADIEFMLGRRMGFYWKICWGVITPCVLLTVMVYFLTTVQKLKNGVHEFPDYVLDIGWCLFAFGISQPIVWWAVFLFKNRKIGLVQAILKSVSFNSWRPDDPEMSEEYIKFKIAKAKETITEQQSWWRSKVSFYLDGF